MPQPPLRSVAPEIPADPISRNGSRPFPARSPRTAPRGLEDRLETLPDRPELEHLYQRDVPLHQLLRLLGHDVDARKIRDLARCDDPRREIRRLLGTA